MEQQSLNQKLQDTIDIFSKYKRIILGIITSVLFIVFVYIFICLCYSDKEIFYTGNRKSMLKITKLLNEKKIPYEVNQNGILMNKSLIPNASLEIFGSDNSVGMEIFDFKSTSLNDTFSQNILYNRALQGELERSVKGLASVLDCRIHINLPKSNFLQKNQENTTAAVVLTLNSKLSTNQIYAIQKLVASSLPRLSVIDVMITDSNGNLLSKDNAHDDNEYQEKLVKDLQSLLFPITGEENIRIAVNIVYNHVNINEESENYSNPVVKTHHKYTQKSNEQAEIPDVATDVQENVINSNTDEVKTEYAVSKTIRHSTQIPGNIEKVSVAIVLNESNSIQIQDIEKLVKSYINFNSYRGDQVSIISMKFVEDINTTQNISEEIYIPTMLIISISIVLFLLLMYIIYYRYFKRNILQEIEKIEEKEDYMYDDANLIDVVKNVVHTNPKQVKQLVRFWLSANK